MSENDRPDQETVDAYRAALAILCSQQPGGILTVPCVNKSPSGTMMWRWVPEGLQFKFEPDGEGKPH